jgi:hypothetical protein
VEAGFERVHRRTEVGQLFGQFAGFKRRRPAQRRGPAERPHRLRRDSVGGDFAWAVEDAQITVRFADDPAAFGDSDRRDVLADLVDDVVGRVERRYGDARSDDPSD